jgi:hypothetical protein
MEQEYVFISYSTQNKALAMELVSFLEQNDINCCIALGNKSEKGAAVQFYFYGDGFLIYQSDYISGNDVLFFQIDVSNVKSLRIECNTDEKVNSYGILEATLHHK